MLDEYEKRAFEIQNKVLEEWSQNEYKIRIIELEKFLLKKNIKINTQDSETNNTLEKKFISFNQIEKEINNKHIKSIISIFRVKKYDGKIYYNLKYNI